MVAAAAAAATAAKRVAAGALKPFKTGTKQVFLPSQMIVLLRPKENDPPTWATFHVPLKFNKFDIRDYLLHAYNVPVVHVRSHLKQKPIVWDKRRARRYRPRPVKTMTVTLTKPFVWPAEPKDLTPWRSPISSSLHGAEKSTAEDRARVRETGKMSLRDEQPPAREVVTLRSEAVKLLKEGGWNNKRTLDPKYLETKSKYRKNQE